jgi:hypothetical protein
MLLRMRITSLAMSVLLSACGGSNNASQTAAAAHSAPAPADDSLQLDEPTNPAFIGRVWIATTPGSPRGSILVFLPNRTLILDSCFETFRLSKWGVAGDRIRWLEESIPIEAEVVTPSKDELRLRIAGRDREQTYVAASIPYTCPDMPR